MHVGELVGKNRDTEGKLKDQGCGADAGGECLGSHHQTPLQPARRAKATQAAYERFLEGLHDE